MKRRGGRATERRGGRGTDQRVAEQADYRRLVTAFLALLSSAEAQRILGKTLEPERLAYELCRAWFDHIYAPSERYLEGLRGDLSHEAADRFRETFDEDELAALERFHRFLELRIERLSDESLKRGVIPLNDPWHALVKDAGYLLEDLGVEADDLRARLVDHLGTKDFEGGPLELILHEESARDR